MWIPIAVLLVGLVLYLLTNGKPSEAGRILFAVGALWTVWALMGAHITVH